MARRRKSSKNLLNKGVNVVTSTVKTTSKKYMPKVKTGLENVGERVVKTSKKSVPFLQRMTRKLFSVFKIKSRKH